MKSRNCRIPSEINVYVYVYTTEASRHQQAARTRVQVATGRAVQCTRTVPPGVYLNCQSLSVLTFGRGGRGCLRCAGRSRGITGCGHGARTGHGTSYRLMQTCRSGRLRRPHCPAPGDTTARGLVLRRAAVRQLTGTAAAEAGERS